MTFEGLAEEADLLAQKEQWAQLMADIVTAEQGIDAKTALAAARWASVWVDDYKTLIVEQPPTSLDEVKACLETARASSLERSVGLPRYPTGVPTVRSIIAAHDVFCRAFGEEAEDIRQLLATRTE
jgi:hypothetical protein